MPLPLTQLVIAIKGAGEMATGIAWRLFQANFKHIFMVEIENPVAVRRQVSFCEAIHGETIEVEGVRAQKVTDMKEIPCVWEKNGIPVLVDPDWQSIKTMRPHVVVDAIIAKKNLGTHRNEAPLVIGLGPGFEAGDDVHLAIETLRGHNLGRIIDKGCPAPNTGVPGKINGFASERLLRAPCFGSFIAVIPLGAMVKKNDLIGHVGSQPVIARIDGILRGLIRDNTRVREGLKIGDIDPRGNRDYFTTISEKARAIGGGVLEAILREYNH
ncbi:MAG: EF2563 family selenium-dependent molybdenum hydroxylase system protein [Proteobacteria bacterium]|nr:EF2563 family selenium-dependent molybdenum hydroxylase system protein [Pseudomonadota bacterium]